MTQPFPVTSSILSAAHLAAFLRECYPLQTPVTAKIIKAGISHTYLINTGTEKFIFRVYSLAWRTEQEINEELKFLDLLKAHALPVSFPIADNTSRYIQLLPAPEGTRFAVLFSFAEGNKVLQFSEELHYSVGQIMARFHEVSLHVQLQRVHYTPERLITDSAPALSAFLEPDKEETKFVQQLRASLHSIFANAAVDQLRSGVVHLDIWFDNMAILDNKHISIFDFDFCGNGWLFLDIAYYVLQLYSTETDEKLFHDKKRKFFAGYESVTTISPEEKRLIPAAGAALYLFYLGVQCQRYDNWSNIFLDEVYLKRFINLRLKRWTDFNHLPLG